MTLKTQQRYKADNGLAYSLNGSGPSVVLVHGVGLRAEAWFQQIEVLSQSHTVYAVDMPGHGDSDLLADEDPSLTQYADAIATFIEQEVKTPVILMGHSMGAMIVVQIAARYPELCAGVVSLNAVYRRTEQARLAVQQRASCMLGNPDIDRVSVPISRWFGDQPQGVELQMSELCARWLNQVSIEGYAKAYRIFSRNDGPLDSELVSIEVPVAFITGELDSNSSATMSQQMAELVPQGSALVVAQSRHMMQLTHASEVNRLILSFIEKCQQQMMGV